MSARSAMQQRMTVERDGAVPSVDDYDSTSDWQPYLEDVPCRYWMRSRLELTPSQTANVAAILEDARVICPVIDIGEGDRILNVKDRAGNVQIDGPLSIQGIERRFEGGGHLELMVREVD